MVIVMISNLEAIENIFNYFKENDQDLMRFNIDDAEWLIQQAYRARKNAQDLDDADRQLHLTQQQNERYRKALERAKDEFWLINRTDLLPYETIVEALEGDEPNESKS